MEEFTVGEPESIAPVLFAEKRAVGGRRVAFATLNAEKALNALSIGMIRLLYGQLQRWEADPEICCIVLQGAGERAFCPGGNLRDIYASMLEYPGPELNNPVMAAFFAEEYRLDYSIHTCSKPLLCWGHGIVMGAGIGLMNGASHRVVTEGSRLAMPEVTIGLYPDVGGSWFLNRMAGRCGLYLFLTCAPMNAADALFLDLGDYFIPSNKKEEVYAALPGLPWMDDSDDNRAVLSSYLRGVEAELKNYSIVSNVRNHFDFIQKVTEGDSLLDFASALREADDGNSWIAGSRKAFFHGSPTSAHVILR